MTINGFSLARTGVLLAGTILSSTAVLAQTAQPAARGADRPAAQGAERERAAPTGPRQPIAPTAPEPTPVAPTTSGTIKSLRVSGAQRIEPETVLSYTKLRVGIPYTAETLDQALKDLQASDLFSAYEIAGVESGDIVLNVRENPIINRVILEGNKRLKEDKITKEIKLKPRQIFTRTAVRQDVARIIELYRRQGRFAANVQPKMVNLDQNRVDIVFEITEGPKSAVRQINIIGNEKFSDDDLRGQMATKQSRWFRLLSSNTTFDQDRLAYDQQKLKQFYLTQGYADFRTTSAVAELTPDKRDFIITYVVEEGKRYKFGDVSVDSEIRDFDGKALAAGLPMKKDDWYNAKQVEDSIDKLSETAGLFGYAFTDVNPEFQRDAEALTMGINFHIAQAQRSYIERINVTGNTQTQDKVIRREIRLAEGDAFNSFQVKRSQDRINSLGYFQDKFELKQTQGSQPDRVILEAPVEEKPTGQLQLSAGYSSLERFIIQANITQSNFRGKGQELRLGANWSSYSRSVEAGFTEPYLFNKSIALGFDIFRRDYNSFNYTFDDRNTIYSQTSTGFQIRTGVPITEYWQFSGRYGLSYDQVSLDDSLLVRGECSPLNVGSYICDQLGNRWTSKIGYSLIYSSLNSSLRPTAGERFTFSQDFAGLGGDARFLTTRIDAAKFWGLGSGFILSATAEGGHIFSFEDSRGPGIDKVRIIDRFYLGMPQFRGFDIRGVGPRVLREFYQPDPETGRQILVTDRNNTIDDALGGRAYYLGKIELEIPLGAGARELGLRPSIYAQVGSLFGIKRPLPTAVFPTTVDANGNVTVQPLVTPVTDAAGRPLYSNIFLPDPSRPNEPDIRDTTCSVGYSATPGGPCSGSEVNQVRTSSQPPFRERFLGNSPAPRVTIGIGVNWNSPFGPLRIDLARALVKQEGDDDRLITFNVGTQF